MLAVLLLIARGLLAGLGSRLELMLENLAEGRQNSIRNSSGPSVDVVLAA
jgi:hypothetical protein